ncbi:MAG: aminomethyltransferase beta-barrel domain-containing protein, partial [Candidatus Nitrotoga sp.]
RQGLGIGGTRGSIGQPWFVAEKNIQENQLIVVQGHTHPTLLSQHLNALEMHWISTQVPDLTRSYAAKTRYRQADAICCITSLSGDIAEMDFSEAQWAVTPGQSVVLYDGEVCLGGGIIQHSV